MPDDISLNDPEQPTFKRRGFQPGHPKYGGRKKGTPIKRTKKGIEIAEAMGFHPVEFLAHVAQHGTMPNPDGTFSPVTTEMRLDAAKSVAPYVAPRLTAAQVTGVDEGPIQTQQVPTEAILQNPALADSLSELALIMAEQGVEAAEEALV